LHLIQKILLSNSNTTYIFLKRAKTQKIPVSQKKPKIAAKNSRHKKTLQEANQIKLILLAVARDRPCPIINIKEEREENQSKHAFLFNFHPSRNAIKPFCGKGAGNVAIKKLLKQIWRLFTVWEEIFGVCKESEQV
jgi:hypothetical protein